MLLNVLGNASTAIERYVPAPERAAVRNGFLDAAARELVAAGPGLGPPAGLGEGTGHHQPAGHGAGWTSSGASWTARRWSTAWPLTPELRWSLWHALAANGQASEAELDAELARDTTASGRAGHATALAARPDAAVKAAAWDAAVNGTALSNQLLSATIAGFNTAPATLLDPFVEPYFECLEKVWAERSIEIASRIVRGLFPAGQDLLGRTARRSTRSWSATDDWLAGHPDGTAGAAPDHHRAAQPPAPCPQGPGRGRENPVGCSVTAVLTAQNGRYGAIDESSRAPGAATPRCRTWLRPGPWRRQVPRRSGPTALPRSGR